jgi:hypothetical protein
MQCVLLCNMGIFQSKIENTNFHNKLKMINFIIFAWVFHSVEWIVKGVAFRVHFCSVADLAHMHLVKGHHHEITSSPRKDR